LISEIASCISVEKCWLLVRWYKQQLTTTYLTNNNLQPLISQTTTYNHLSHKQQLTTTYLTNNNLQPLISQTTTYNHLSHKQQLHREQHYELPSPFVYSPKTQYNIEVLCKVSENCAYNYNDKQQLTTTNLTNNNLQPLFSHTTYNHLPHKQQLATTYLTNNNLQPLISQTKWIQKDDDIGKHCYL
jgi:hypothetical protein